MIRRNVEAEARMIDDLLDLTRIGRDEVRLRCEVVDVHAALRAALESCRDPIEAKRLEVVLDLRAERHHAWADSVRLQRVFAKLLDNAARFTPEGGRIGIRTGWRRERSADGDRRGHRGRHRARGVGQGLRRLRASRADGHAGARRVGAGALHRPDPGREARGDADRLKRGAGQGRGVHPGTDGGPRRPRARLARLDPRRTGADALDPHGRGPRGHVAGDRPAAQGVGVRRGDGTVRRGGAGPGVPRASSTCWSATSGFPTAAGWTSCARCGTARGSVASR